MGGRFTRTRAFLAVAVVGAGLVVLGGASGVTPQSGQNNYAGPRTCADANATFGVTFDSCTADTADVSQNSSGGLNVYEASGNGGKVAQTNTTGANKAFCILNATVSGAVTSTTQSCDFAQSGNGGNEIVADVKAMHDFSQNTALQDHAQDASITLKANQSSANGNNTVAGPSGAPALLKTSQNLTPNLTVQVPVTQRQERLILLDVDQNASGSGNNSVDFNLDSTQNALGRGLHPLQEQDVRSNGASDPNAKAYIYQRTATGTNYTKGRGLDSKSEESHTLDSALGGSATQKQWHSSGGFDIVADVDSSGNPDGGVVDFGTPYAEGTDCAVVDGFRKIGVIKTYNDPVVGSPQETTSGTRRQDDGLPIGIPGLSPKTATTASCSKLTAPAGTFQHAGLSVKGHAKQTINGSMSAALNSGGNTSAFRAFNAQTVNEVLDCTRNTPNTCTTTAGGITGSGVDITANEDESFTKDVAQYVNNNPNNPVTSASINWGDNTAPSSGTTNGTGPYTVRGTHTYADPGTYTITTTLTQQDASTAVFTSKATVADVVEGENIAGGAFVIGDKSTDFSTGSTVTFWSQSWATYNPVTTGTSPSGFKGWENTVTSPQCGSPNWQARTGNAPPPPAGALPRYIRVIVTSSIGKAGSNPQGNVAKIVVVDTQGNSYNPNPASNGVGKIVRVECG